MQASNPLAKPAQQALDKLQALCPMRFEKYVFGSECLKIWTACDIDPLLNSLVDKDDSHPDVTDERMPYWAELWPSSLLMAETIVERRDRLPKGDWLELGCGPGLPGIMAARTGHAGICSDYMEEALWLACLNAHQNHCAEKISFRKLDWRQPPVDLQTGWILAGDVVYESRNFEALFTLFDRLLGADGEIWLGEPGRSIAKPFFEGMQQRGWNREVLNSGEEVTLHRFIR